MLKKKDKLIEKIVKKNYNNELEEILEKKNYDENTKSILLSILYKIEVAYKDYEKVKSEVETKEEFIQMILEIIKNECENITVVRLNSEESKILTNKSFLVEKENKRIICYPIERKLLYCIAKIDKKPKIIKEKYYLITDTLSELINVGNNINTVEPMRDFNGYSWTTLSREIESISHNLVYQNLRILIGYKYLNKWIKSKEYIIDYFEVFKNKFAEQYGENLQKKFTNILEDLSVLIAIKYNNNLKGKLKNDIIEIEEEIKLVEDNEKFVNNLTKNKKELTKQIKQIDETLNNKSLLQEEYKKRNENLPLEKKIFSVRILSQILIAERNKKIDEIEKLNELLVPKKFIEYKKELEKKYKLLQLVQVENNEKEIEKYFKKLQLIFLECFEKKIKKIETKHDIIKMIYEFRYYCLLPFNDKQEIYEINELKTKIEEIQKELINKAIEFKTIEKISKNDNVNYIVIKEIFKLRVISLEDLNVKIIKEKEKYFMQLFDENIVEEKIEINGLENVDKKDLKLNKKMKFFL